MEDGDPVDTESASLSFAAFSWPGNKDTYAATAVKHLKDQLVLFGVNFSDNGFNLYDVHNEHTLLNVDDPKIGKISGGTDCVIAPRRLLTESIMKQACVVFEFKTNLLENHFPQAKLELIAALYLSDQTPIVILTDLCTGAFSWRLHYEDPEGKILSFRQRKLTLNEMGKLVVQHLSTCSSKVVRLMMDDDQISGCNSSSSSSSITAMREFKKQRVTPLSELPAWQHFMEFLPYTSHGSVERAEVVKDFFAEAGLGRSNLLNSMMYT